MAAPQCAAIVIPELRGNRVQSHQEIDPVRQPHADARNGRNRPAGQWRRHGEPWRHRRAGYRRRREEAEARPGFLSADRRLPGKDVRRRQDSRWFLQARRAPVGEGDADVAADRPSFATALSRRPLQRRADRRDGDVGRSRDRSGHPGDDRRVRGRVAVRRAIQRSDRRGARRLCGRPVRPEPDEDRSSRNRSSISSSPARKPQC